MTYLVFLKYAGIAVAIIGLVMVVHQDGRSVERGVCAAAKNAQLQKAQDDLKASITRNEKLARENQKLNDEVRANAAKQMQQVAAADAAMRRDRAGLRIPTEACRKPVVQLSGPTSRASGDNADGRFEGVRLPERIETDLYDYAARANRTRVKRDECQDFAIGLAKMREEWERQQDSIQQR